MKLIIEDNIQGKRFWVVLSVSQISEVHNDSQELKYLYIIQQDILGFSSSSVTLFLMF